MLRILVAEDDDSQRKILCTFLRMHQYEVLSARDGEEALSMLEEAKVDLAICDVMMPRMDGFELTRNLRMFDKTLPILIITAKGEQSDKQIGFLAGTDDYMVKPVDLEEMLLRVKALLRRSNMQTEHFLRIGSTTVNELEGTVVSPAGTLPLTRKEFGLLFMLLSYPGQIFTRRQLMDAVWSVDCDTDERTVDVHIKRLRNKLTVIQDFQIATVHGFGYRAEVTHAQE